MGLESDIQQNTFRNNYQKGIINFIFTYNWLREKMKVIFDREEITEQQFNILRILRGAGKPISTLQIRQRMLDKMSDTSRIVDRLVIKSLVKKTVCPSDKRLVDISITDKGKKILSNIDAYELEIDNLLINLNDDEISSFNTLLDKIRGNA